MIDFFEFSNEMLSLANDQGYLTRVNPAWTKTLGWTAEELTNRPYIDFVHPDDLAATLKEAELLASGTHETIGFENRYRCRDGSYRWLAWRVVVPAGSHQLVASARDITERKLVETRLQESEERFRAFMDNNPAIAWAKDEQGRLVYMNKAVERAFRIPVEDLLGKTLFQIMPEDVARPLWEHDQTVLTTARPMTIVERTVFHTTESAFWLTSKFLFGDRHGRRYVGGCGVDITELKRAEESLLAEHDFMRGLIDVQEKEKQILCHDFHDGVLQHIAGSLMALEALQRQSPELASSPTIEAVIANLRQGIEDGRQTIRGIRPAVLDDSGIAAAIEDLGGQFSRDGFRVTVICDSGIGRLAESSQVAVYRIVQESLNNAKNHSGTNAASVELEQSDGELQLVITDQGCGFDVKPATKKGFGLVGMMQRVQLLGGHCRIESTPGAGTRVAIRLPVVPTSPHLQPG
ncbi:MAG: PAS domain S-box protein [Gemmataceae bacterium]